DWSSDVCSSDLSFWIHFLRPIFLCSFDYAVFSFRHLCLCCVDSTLLISKNKNTLIGGCISISIELRCRIWLLTVNIFNTFKNFFRQINFKCLNIFFQLIQIGGTNNGTGYKELLLDKGQSQLR